jgi:uncharacterized membrane protein YphA (DoxX/SURF4 family)
MDCFLSCCESIYFNHVRGIIPARQSQSNESHSLDKHKVFVISEDGLLHNFRRARFFRAIALRSSKMLAMPSLSALTFFAPVVLRYGLVALFLWFGLSQVLNPEMWIAWVPEWVDGVLGLSAIDIVLINGWLESVGGSLLLIGFQTRLVALILSLHLFFIAFEVGYNDVGVRDFILAVATLALFMFGPDKYSLDDRVTKS